ncbi:homoserine O-acetyltransferase [Striga asiatica]|uniref:Homoserine O-acetyltransferase n=1 Tax=Striga asiatica TaxID=4170 RepID=A0A5A7Q465_STRAF|nr:homoserine O-acetyltransferase [Striga asiatica]
MASSAPPSATPIGSRKPLGFLENAKKSKQSFIQFFAMTGILLLSCRSLGQKYRIHNLTEDASALKEDQEGLIARMNHIKRSLRAEAALEPTGAFAARLRLLFGDESD